MLHFVDILVTFDDGRGPQGPIPTRFEELSQEIMACSQGLRADEDVGSDGARRRPLFHLVHSSWVVWCLGELWPTGSGEQPGPPAGLDEFVEGLAAGHPRPDRLNGHFFVLAYERGAGRLHAWTDRFGTLHAYHAWDGRRAALGTYFPAVAALASGRQLDWEGLTGFLGFGFFPQDRTYFDDVRILRPASHYVFDADGRLASLDRYWHWKHVPDPSRSYDDTVAEFASVFGRVMADQFSDGPVAVPISGGLDSRSIVAPLRPSKMTGDDLAEGKPWSFSYGYSEDSIETRIARRVAAARGLPFQALTVRPYLLDRLGEVLHCIEGFQDLTKTRQIAATAEIGRHADRVIAAHWGDVWHDETGLAGANSIDETGLLNHALKKFRKRGREWLLERVCRPQLRGSDPEAVLTELVRPELDSLRQIDDPDFRVKALKTDQWSSRWTTASLRAYQLGAFPRLPFYDTRVADFFETVPTQFVAGRRLQIDYLKRFASDLAQVTWQPCGANLYRYRSARFWGLPARVFNKARQVLIRQRDIQRNWEVQFQSAEGRRGLDAWLLKPGLAAQRVRRAGRGARAAGRLCV